MLQSAYGLVSESALRLGRYADAEKAARRQLELPLSPFADPNFDRSERQVQLALALAYQGKTAEARSVLAPALQYYAGEKKAGAGDTFFYRDYADALLASAVAQEPDAAGRAARHDALAAAEAELRLASAEARQLSSYRDLSRRVAEARADGGG
jgi:hypothetical protein